MTVKFKIKQALDQCVTGGKCQFLTYGAFSKKFDISAHARSWANRVVLDSVADEYRKAGQLDLTFLLSNGRTKYPSVIDGKPSNPPSQDQKARAKEVAQQIINQHCRGADNPY
jgi:hypothetical protein